ncbi:sulfatase-like hydrolase/transferase [Photobacterium sagamiensis]|uniref:sulfatase/phosphatase domain-containing protein n=1 Tax=Photobacterium sagamiensis TaxID=2910241 RepID=UPI003D0B3F86
MPPYFPDTPAVRETIAMQYNNSITMDERVGEILAQLEEDGLSNDTIIIWTTDHGDGFPRAKREVYDSSLKVPMTIYWPEKWRPKHVKAGTTDDQLISFVDIAPTILSMTGADIPEYMVGKDFTVEGGANREYIYAAKDRMDEAEDRVRAVSDGRFKYMRNYRTDVPAGQHVAFRDGMVMMDDMWRMREEGTLTAEQNQWFDLQSEEQLFDTLSDPDELKDISNNPEYKETLERMRAQLAKWQERDEDFRLIPESELAEEFWPNSVQPITESSELNVWNGKVVITNDNPAASIGYRINGGAWQLYTRPIEITDDMNNIITKAIRYGWAESEETFIKL